MEQYSSYMMDCKKVWPDNLVIDIIRISLCSWDAMTCLIQGREHDHLITSYLNLHGDHHLAVIKEINGVNWCFSFFKCEFHMLCMSRTLPLFVMLDEFRKCVSENYPKMTGRLEIKNQTSESCIILGFIDPHFPACVTNQPTNHQPPTNQQPTNLMILGDLVDSVS